MVTRPEANTGSLNPTGLLGLSGNDGEYSNVSLITSNNASYYVAIIPVLNFYFSVSRLFICYIANFQLSVGKL